MGQTLTQSKRSDVTIEKENLTDTVLVLRQDSDVIAIEANRLLAFIDKLRASANGSFDAEEGEY